MENKNSEDVNLLKKRIEELERKLELTEGESLRQAFENAAIGMALVNLTGRWIKVNRSLCEITGYSEQELLQKTFQDITHPEDLDTDLYNLKQLLDNKIQYYHMEKRYFHKNGHVIWVILSVSLAKNQKGKPLYFISQIQDITHIKLAKEALEYDKLKTEFFANISHELRTPINIILSAVQLLNMYADKNQLSVNESSVKEYLRIMKQNCYRTIRLINNLIDTTRIDADFYSLNLRNHNVVQIVEDIALSVAKYIEAKGINLTFDTDIEEKIISCDADKIERIILNLLSNAVKFTKKNGGIKVSVLGQEEHIRISVQDDGIGIEEDKLNLIFERFGQVDKTLVRNHEGSGIGLSLVKSFVEMHGGEVTVMSQYGQGSEFIVMLPIRVLEEESIENQSEVFSQQDEELNSYVEMVNIEFSDIYF